MYELLSVLIQTSQFYRWVSESKKFAGSSQFVKWGCLMRLVKWIAVHQRSGLQRSFEIKTSSFQYVFGLNVKWKSFNIVLKMKFISCIRQWFSEIVIFENHRRCFLWIEKLISFQRHKWCSDVYINNVVILIKQKRRQ